MKRRFGSSGTLQCLDDRMNIALESAKEYSTKNTVSAEYKSALIRGNNGMAFV